MIVGLCTVPILRLLKFRIRIKLIGLKNKNKVFTRNFISKWPIYSNQGVHDFLRLKTLNFKKNL